MLNAHNIGISFNGTFLFEEVSFKLSAGDRVGLIGKNGAGKSTLLKILSRDLEAETGVLALDKEVKVGVLRQDIDFIEGNTVLQEAYLAFPEIIKLEKELENINNELATRTDYESEYYNDLLNQLTEVTHSYEIFGGYTYPGETEKVLQGLGFSREDFDKPTESFSGGWRMRIELAKLLLQQNEVLLLDEPTNHLDIESILWLESFLTASSGAVVIVSHDKMFLDNVTNRTIEISLGRIYDYKKPYSKFLELRAEIRAQQINAQRNQEKQIQQTERLIEKFRAKASKASMAQSLIKKLDKVERIEVEQEDTSVMHLNFPVSITPGKVVLTLKDVGKSYASKRVINGIDLLVERGSKIAFVGQNGQGKTTLAKLIVGEIEGEGQIIPGHNVQLGYFAQNQAHYLPEEQTIQTVMIEAANESNRSKVRDILGAFLFQGDEVDKQVKVLSGGERNRLALARLLLKPFNVLILDEPTNHLDITSKNVLKEALKKFEGTLILVSHDRDFLQGLTEKVYEFKNGGIKEYLGDIDFYLEARQADNFRAIERKDTPKEANQTTISNDKQDYETQKKLKGLMNKLSKCEKDIAQLEKEIGEMDHRLLMNYDQTASDPYFFDNYQEKKKVLETRMLDWESFTMQIEEIEG